MSAVYTVVVVVNVVVVVLLLLCCCCCTVVIRCCSVLNDGGENLQIQSSLLFITSDRFEAKEKIWDAAHLEGTSSLHVHSRVHTRTGSIFNESSRGNAPSSQLKAAPPQV